MKRKLLVTGLCILSPLLFVFAKTTGYGDIMAHYVKNYDADTITVNIPGWPDIIGKKIGVRVNGIDTPEMRGGTEATKQLARQAQKYVEIILKDADKIILRNMERGKYFRIVADVELDGADLGELLIRRGYARPYDGKGPRPDWTKEK